MKKLLATMALMTTVTAANASEVYLGLDSETKYKNNQGNTIDYVYTGVKHTFKSIDTVVDVKHYRNVDAGQTSYNSLKLMYKGLKYNSVSITPSWERRFDKNNDNLKNNIKVQVGYKF